MTCPSRFLRLFFVTGLALALLPEAGAQWLTQSFRLKPGWNAIYSHVDASHESLENVVGATSPISEIWLWKDEIAEGRIIREPAQFVSGSDWEPWSKATGSTNATNQFSFRANTAYLVRNAGPTEYLWNVKGRPVPPVTRWTATGLNLIDFSTRAELATNFFGLLAPAPGWSEFQLYHYPGGEAAGAPPKAASLTPRGSVEPARGRAVWVKKRDNSDNRYFGPFEFVLQDYRGIIFSESLGVYSLRLRNALDVTNVVAATLVLPEPSPTGVTNPVPPLLLRTTLDSQTLRYAYTSLPLNVARTFTLAPRGKPGSDVEVVLGLDRLAMSASPGSPYSAVLRLEDQTLRHLQVDLPVSAIQGSQQGLWVGEAAITHVGNYLKTYARATNAVDFTNQFARLADFNQGNASVRMPNQLWNLRALNPTEFAGAAAPKPWVALAMASDAGRRIAATELGTLVHSVDAGRSWNEGIGLGGTLALACSRNGSNWVAGVAGGPLFTATNGGISWVSRDANRTWVGVASSADGTRLAAVVLGGSIHISTNAGVDWSPRGANTNWSAIASSADGSVLVATIQNGPLMVSSDSGETWTERDVARDWQSVACSDDGQRWVASVNGGLLYTSADFGATWAARDEIRNWGAVASSTNGTHLVALELDGRIHTSTNAGLTWTAGAKVADWAAVASSADGRRLAAAERDGFLYDSLDGGVSWTVTSPSLADVASSGDGLTLLAAIRGGSLYRSDDFGTNWTALTTSTLPPATNWHAVASSSDGTRLGAVVGGGKAYFSSDSGTNWSTPGNADFPSADWRSIATSADGLSWVLGNANGALVASTDGGATFSKRFQREATAWQGIAGSRDGRLWFAAPHDGPLHGSVDGGMTWKALVGASVARWQAIACSSNGQVVVAAANPGGSSTFSVGDFVGLPSLASRLKRPKGTFDTWLAEQLSSATKAALTDYQGQGSDPSALQQALLQDFNHIVRGGLIYEQKRFGGVALRSETQTLISENPRGSALERLNRLLIEDAYPLEVSRSQPGGIHLSIDAGVTWDTVESVPSLLPWVSIACSADGKTIVAVPEVGLAYASTDGGKSWSTHDAARRWVSVTVSADGTRWAAGALGETAPVLTAEGSLITPELAYDPASNRILSGDGKYLTAGFDTALGEVPTPFRLRLIIHHDSQGRSRLLDEVFYGTGAATTDTILTVDESKLNPALLAKARRLSAVHLPFSGGGWPLNGEFGGTGILNGAFTEGYDTTASNPFLHAYHPDHDNWDPLYGSRVERGDESYDVRRQITLSFAPPGDDFASRTTAGTRVQGTYLENIVLKGGNNQMRTMVTQGRFLLNRISSIGILQ